MIRALVIPWILVSSAFAAEEPSDLLRFINGDQLHGSFEGIKTGPSAVWKREDIGAPVEFKTDQVRHVVLRGGRPLKPLASLSHVALVSGDRIPGTLTALDDTSFTLETSYAGVLKIPRNQVAMFAPSPLGGRLHYHGPFREDEWRMANASFPDGMPPPAKEGENAESKDEPGRWAFSGSAWYWSNKSSGTALIREGAMPDRSILRFDLAWKNRLSFAIGFHADFAKPKHEKEEKDKEEAAPRRLAAFAPGDSTVLPELFGNSYVLQVFSTHMMLFRTAIDDNGEPVVERVQLNGSSMRLGDSGKATIEIRSNRQTGGISLFVNDEFVVQWNEGSEDGAGKGHYAGKGNGFGFVVQTEDSPVRISDVMVAEWNGMPDSARSLQVDEQDVVLLANGTDRFAGKVGGLEDGKMIMEGKYGRFRFDLADIAEIRFARNKLAEETSRDPGSLTVRLHPLGKISGRPLSGDRSSVKLQNPFCGEINLNLESAVMLDFQYTGNVIDDWDAEF